MGVEKKLIEVKSCRKERSDTEQQKNRARGDNDRGKKHTKGRFTDIQKGRESEGI